MSHDVVNDWTTKAGLRAVVLFIKDSHHCGYVAIPKDHPLHGVAYNTKHVALRWDHLQSQTIGKRGVLPVFCAALRDESEQHVSPDVYFDVHGSITYSDGGDDYPARGDGLWWFGYDCSHAGDLTKRDEREGWGREGVFRDADYCIEECESLASQLEAVRDTAARSAV